MSARGTLAVVDGVPITADTIRAYGGMCRMLTPSLRRFARTFAPSEDDVDDMLQEAMIALWNVGAFRFNARDKAEVSYLRRVLINRMWKVWGGDSGRLARKAARARIDMTPDERALRIDLLLKAADDGIALVPHSMEAENPDASPTSEDVAAAAAEFEVELAEVEGTSPADDGVATPKVRILALVRDEPEAEGRTRVASAEG